MINQQIPYAFNQFELALLGFFSDFRKRINFLIPNAPVFFQNTGDFSYFMGKKFHKVRTSDIYQKTPRVVIKLEDIQVNQAEDTMFINQMDYIFDGTEYTCTVRRRTHNVTIQIYFVSPSIISMMNHIEIMAIFGARPNVFTYEFMGNTIDGQYTIQSNSSEIPTVDAGSQGSRNATYMTTIELQVPLWIPKIETIKNRFDANSGRIEFNLQVMHQDLVEYETNLELLESKENGTQSNNDSNNDQSIVSEIFDSSKFGFNGAINGTELARRLTKQDDKQ